MSGSKVGAPRPLSSERPALTGASDWTWSSHSRNIGQMSARDLRASRFQWDDLRYFLEVARAQSLLDAAAKLGVSHSTVSRRITALEADLSAELFEKKPSGYELSETGKYLFDYAQNIETGCIQLQDAVAHASSRMRTTVRLSVPEGFGCHFLPRHLNGFLDEHPDIDLEILAQPNSLSVSKREADVSVTLERPTVGRLIGRVLTDYALNCYASRHYLEGRPAICALEDLRQHRLIVTQHPANSPEMRLAETILPAHSARLRFKSINAQLAAVEAGLGISLIPCYMAERSDLCKVLPAEVKVLRTYWICMHADMRAVPRVRTVWDWLIALVEREQCIILGG
jgi:DNA-binding transcriptional LysR family regulator